MATKKSDLPKNIQAAVDLANDTQAPYEDRRATPGVKDPGYVIEEDPILAIGDDRVHVPTEAERAQVKEFAMNTTGLSTEEIDARLQAIADERAVDPPERKVVLATDPSDPIARLASAMEKMAERQAGPSPMDPTLVALLSGMMETMKALVESNIRGNATNAEALRRSQDPSNPFAPDVSVFNPRGERDHPRPKLKCKMFLPWEAEWESLTREEIELLNLLETGEFFIKRNDESRIMMSVAGSVNPNNGRYDRLLMNSETALNNDYHQLMPPLRQWVRQILNQRPGTKVAASKVMSMEDEIDLISQHGVDYEKVLELAK